MIRFLSVVCVLVFSPGAQSQTFETASDYLLLAQSNAATSFPKVGNAVQDLINGLTDFQDLVAGYAVRGAMPGKDAEVKAAITAAKAKLDSADSDCKSAETFVKDANNELGMAWMAFQMFNFGDTVKYSAWCVDSCSWASYYAEGTTARVKTAREIISAANKLLVPQ